VSARARWSAVPALSARTASSQAGVASAFATTASSRSVSGSGGGPARAALVARTTLPRAITTRRLQVTGGVYPCPDGASGAREWVATGRALGPGIRYAPRPRRTGALGAFTHSSVSAAPCVLRAHGVRWAAAAAAATRPDGPRSRRRVAHAGRMSRAHPGDADARPVRRPRGRVEVGRGPAGHRRPLRRGGARLRRVRGRRQRDGARGGAPALRRRAHRLDVRVRAGRAGADRGAPRHGRRERGRVRRPRVPADGRRHEARDARGVRRALRPGGARVRRPDGRRRVLELRRIGSDGALDPPPRRQGAGAADGEERMCTW
jgi:hypothetical protein